MVLKTISPRCGVQASLMLFSVNYKFSVFGSFSSEQRLLPYGETAGDTELVLGQLQSSVTKERVSTLISIPQGLPLFDGQLVNSLYVSLNS